VITVDCTFMEDRKNLSKDRCVIMLIWDRNTANRITWGTLWSSCIASAKKGDHA
jgi:hypothetical protein